MQIDAPMQIIDHSINNSSFNKPLVHAPRTGKCSYRLWTGEGQGKVNSSSSPTSRYGK